MPSDISLNTVCPSPYPETFSLLYFILYDKGSRLTLHSGPTWQSRISAICLTNPLHDIHHLHPPEFAKFIATRTRAYLISTKPLDENIAGRYAFGCNCYSSGEALNVECMMPRAWQSMVTWLDEMYKNQNLEEVEVIVPEEFEGEVAAGAMPSWKDGNNNGWGQGWGEGGEGNREE